MCPSPPSCFVPGLGQGHGNRVASGCLNHLRVSVSPQGAWMASPCLFHVSYPCPA